MSYPERGFRRIRSIPPRTSLDVLREGDAIRISRGNLSGDSRRASREPTIVEPDWSPRVVKHVFQKPPGQEKTRPEPPYGRGGKIEYEVEIMEDYNGKGDLGIILQFAGIGLNGGPFLRGRRNYGPDSAVFYTQVGYKNKTASLVLATRGDIFESQIVPVQMDVNPFFKEELYLSQLTKTHDPTTMVIFQNNKLFIVGYKPRIH